MKITYRKTNQSTYPGNNIPVNWLYLMLFLLIILPWSSDAFSQKARKITGTITEENGKPLPGATVLIEGTTTGAASDVEGRYSMETTVEKPVLLVSFMGYRAQKIPVEGRAIIDINMVPDFQALEEVVVVGYGTQKKVNMSGAVDVVSSKELTNRPVPNVTQVLQGLAPNLNVTVSNDGGEVGGKMNMNIRGLGSINGGAPYVLVDGIEQDIYKINPDDIETITVLKDAAAAAIYGARAAFGVVLVTTKKGRNDGISVSYSNNYSWASPTLMPHTLNSLDFAQYFNDACDNSGVPRQFAPVIIDYMKKYQAGEIDYWTIPYPLNPQWWLSYNGSWANTDWYKESYKSWVPNNTHNLSFSGGDAKTQFYVSGSLFNQAGLLRYGHDNHSRKTINMKLTTQVLNWLKFNFSSKVSRTNISRPSYDKGQFYYGLSRQWPTNAPYYPDGNLAGEAIQIWLEKGGQYDENQSEYTIVPGVEIQPLKGWTIYGNYRWKMNPSGYTDHQALVYGTDAYSMPHLLPPGVNSYTMANYETSYNSPNIYSTYTKKSGIHDFTIMAGYEQELYQYNWTWAKRSDLVTDDVPSLPTATGRQENNGGMGHSATRSFFGRFNYSLKDRYLVELSARYDGSSKFPENYRWGLFPSGSFAYILSKENYWASLQRFVNVFKLRASYGSLGNQDVENYLYIEQLPIGTNLAYIFGDTRPNYVTMAGLVSPGITWEKVRTSNIGFDASFLKSRLNLSFDYFVRNTLDMLGPAESYPTVLGTAVPKSNNACLRTNGFELVLEWRDNIDKFAYSAKVLLADAQSTITSYYNPQKLLSGAFYEGAKLGEIWGYTTVGLFKSDEEAQDPSHDQSYLSPELWRAGDVNYKDINGDKKIDMGNNTVGNSGDKSIIGNSTPRYTYSGILTCSWKGIDFNMLWQGVGKRDLALDGSLFWGIVGNKWWNIGLQEHMDYWTEENKDAYWARPYFEKWEHKNQQVQTRYLQNGAYLRLKSLQIGYTIPEKLTRKVKIGKLRLYASGENLVTFTRLITIFDPEVTGGEFGSGTLYPLQKILSGGLNITF